MELGTHKQRALLAALALSRGRAVSVDMIIDLLWGDHPPRSVSGTLQAYVAGLRRSLEPDRPARAPASVLVTEGGGYALRLPEEALDVVGFERAVTSVHQAVEPIATLGATNPFSRRELLDLARRLDGALACWRGAPFADLGDAPSAQAERARLEELRLVAVESRMVIALALGQHALAAAELEHLTRAHPLRERLWALRAVALVRAGRQAEALEVLREVREVLDAELGLDPGPELRELQSAILRQDPVLDWIAPAQSGQVGDGAEPQSSMPPAVSAAVPAASPSHSGEPPASRTAAIPAQGSAAVAWPLVGRDTQLRALTDRLAAADEDTPQFAVILGEPGIGKSRLAAEVIGVARARGARVLTGRCSQDGGAPPLWPWAAVLRGLDQDLPTVLGDEEGAQFRTWEGIVSAVGDTASDELVVVALDDLQWADTSTLRVLRLLAETVHRGRLLVLVTWRARPEPTGSLAEVAEALARRHALRVELEGLGTEAAAELVERVAHERPTSAEADSLRDRTEGNPFFLVEFARLAAERGDLTSLLAEEQLPAAVHDVLVRRLARLPEPTVELLRVAAVIGRDFDLVTLAGSAGHPEEQVLDGLDVAMASGLVREDGIDHFVFAHALVRDTITAGLSASRRARLHARVAQALSMSPTRETERARHWLAAGPSHAHQAWRAAVSAAAVTRRLYAYESSEELLCAALTTMDLDPRATPRDRYDVLMQLVDAYRWMGRWTQLVATVEECIGVAGELGDVEAVALAAMAPTQGALWQSGPHGQVHAVVVDALRRSLASLPPEDSAMRCRAMLSLANELYYGATFEERRALVDEGVAMARRLADEALLLDAYQIAFAALWCHRTAEERLGYVREAIGLARALDNESALVVSLTLKAVVEGELGRVEEMWSTAAQARELAERLRLPYAFIVLDSLELPWAAMAGRFDDCERYLARIRQLQSQMEIPQGDDAAAGALITLMLWQGRSAEVGPLLAAIDGGSLPILSCRVVFHCRGGELDQARRLVAERPVDLSGDDWFAMLNWCCAAEAALWLGDAELGSAAYERIAPYAGRSCSAGSGNAMGPTDAYLAQAAAAVGEGDLAARHADRALELMTEWRIPLVAQWFRGQRDRFGF